jgi:hypothetical protein
MAVELVRNLAETTLASSYTSGGSSIEVDDATGFPSTGAFRVALGNAGRTIFRVDSVSGTTFTGGAEEFDASASAGDTVVGVGTRGSFERLIQTPASGEIHAYSGVSAADRYGPIWKMTPLDQSGWSWVNQGDASVTQASGVVFLNAPSAAAQNLRIRKTSAPATPYTITVALICEAAFTGSFNVRTRPSWRQSSDGKLVTIGYLGGNGVFEVLKFNSATSFSASYAARNVAARPSLAFIRMTDNGTNRVVSTSFDGVNFRQLHSVGRTDFMTADEVGIFIGPESGHESGLSIVSWVQS